MSAKADVKSGAVAAATPMVAGGQTAGLLGYQMLPRTKIRVGKTNPRKFFDAEKLEALAANILEQGILQPLVVRFVQPRFTLHEPDLVNKTWLLLDTAGKPVKAGTEKECREHAGTDGLEMFYELVAGERRWRASGIAKLDLVPAIVRRLTDAEVLEIQYIENLQREDLSAMEEAEGFGELIKSGLYTHDTLAEKLSVKRSTIFNRLKLLKLSEPVKAALREGRIDKSVAGIIAKVAGSEKQAEVLAAALAHPHDYHKKPMTVLELEEYIAENYQHSLKEVPFDLKDKTLDHEAGPCTTCPKRTGNMTEMYPELKSPNVCTDPACLERKLFAWKADAEQRARKAGRIVLTDAEYQKQRRTLVDLDGKCYDGALVNGEYPTYRQVLGKHAPEAAVLILDGQQHEFAPAAAVEKILEERKLVPPPKPDAYAVQEEERRTRCTLRRRVLAEAIDQAVDKAISCPVDVGFWRRLVLLVLRQARFNGEHLRVQRPQIERQAKEQKITDQRAQLEAYATKWMDQSEPNLRGLLVSALLCPEVDYQGNVGPELASSLAMFGVDWAKVERELQKPKELPGKKFEAAAEKTKAKAKTVPAKGREKKQPKGNKK